jgi:hypothetical protein
MMRLKRSAFLVVLALVFLGTMAWADQIILKDGTVYSGKFVRGDANSVDFRVLGRIETFRVSDIAQIIFKEPELESSSSARTITRPPVPQPGPGSATRELPPSQPQPAPEPPALSRENPPQVADPGITLPTGTPVTIRTSTAIDTDRNRVGDVFDASLDQPLVWGDQTIFPRGTTVKGRIANAKESGKLTGQSQLVLELTEIVANGKSYLLRTSDYSETGSNRGNRTAATVGGTAVLGTIIGAIAGGGTGAAVGAASGAAVGTGVQVMTKGQTLKIPAETILEFRLQSPLTVNVP